MAFHHHLAEYSLGEGELKPEDRVVVGTRRDVQEAMRIAQHLGLSSSHPDNIIDHHEWADGEYLPVFLTKDLSRFTANYVDAQGLAQWGSGLKGKTVYIVHTLSNQKTSQDLATRVDFIASGAKYHGAEAVVLLAYTLNYSAQERGVHDKNHPRMQKEEALRRFDGQAPTAQNHLMKLAVSGVDAIVTPHNHSPDDLQRICQEVNEELSPLHHRALEQNHTLRYHLSFYDLNLAPVIGTFITEYGAKKLSLNLRDKGKNILFLAVDKGITPFVRSCRQHSELTNSALASMNKVRARDGIAIDSLELAETENLSPEKGIEGMQVFVMDDMIRTGSTMDKNIRALSGQNLEDIKRSEFIKGKPERVAVYTTRNICQPQSIDLLFKNPMVKDVLITNGDARARHNLGRLATKTQILWINFVMGAAAKAIECGEDPNAILTPKYIREHQLLHIHRPHEHYRNTGDAEGII